MFLTLTIKHEADSKGELVETFPSKVAEVRNHFEELRKAGVLGPAEQVEIRHLIIGGQWRGPATPEEITDPNEELSEA